MKHSDLYTRLFAWLFLSTGVFAIVGALFTWGDGWLFLQDNPGLQLVPWADLIVTSPLSCVTAYGIWVKKKWGIPFGLMTCGVYLFGSVLVYIQVFVQGPPYPFRLVVPPIFGMGIVCFFVTWVIAKDKIQ